MKYRVKITKMPQAKNGQQVNNSLQNTITNFGGSAFNRNSGSGSDLNVSKTLTKVPRNEANLEAEGGESAFGDINGDGFTEHYKIKGPRHTEGGVNLNLPNNTFIFSDTKDMRIKDPAILAKFGKTVTGKNKSKSYTPAQLAAKYDVNKYRQILQDPNSDKLDKRTAEKMIENYNLKLGALSLAQESIKGFPQSIPVVAKPYMEQMGLREEDIIPQQPQQQQMEIQQMQSPQEEMVEGMYSNPEEEMMEEPMMEKEMMAYGGMIPYMSVMENGGQLTQYQDKGEVKELKKGDKEGYYPENQLTKEEEVIIKNKWAGNKEAYLDFKATKEAVMNNPDFKDKLYDKYKKVITDPKNYTSKTVDGWYKGLENRSPEDVVRELLNQEERNARLAAYNHDAINSGQGNAKGAYTNQKTIDFIKANPGLSDLLEDKGALNFDRGYVGQAAYIAYDDYMKELNPEGYKITNTGKPDELEGRPTISGIDNKNNDTTLLERMNYLQSLPKSKAVDAEIEKTNKEIKTNEETTFVEDIPFKQPRVETAEWTTPAIMNYTNALANRFNINKEMGWNPMVDSETVNPVYLDPTRELANQSEQANLMSSALSQFTGPQATSSRLSSIQGTAAEQAANTLARYNNANVSTANQFEAQNAAIRNQESMMRSKLADELYDQNIVGNQQFKNAKKLANQEVINAFASGTDEAGKIATMNAMYPQYRVNPKTRTVEFTEGKDSKPELANTFNTYLKMYKEDYGMKDADAIRAAREAMGVTSNSALDVNSILASAKRGGSMYVLGSRTFPFLIS
jgi:hypothetical protein